MPDNEKSFNLYNPDSRKAQNKIFYTNWALISLSYVLGLANAKKSLYLTS